MTTPDDAVADVRRAPGRLREVGLLFLKLGTIGFGGPAAHIAMMRDEVVRRRGWLDDAEFLDWVAACNLIPGPNSTELATHLGARRAGGRGLVLAGVAFILPAVVIVSVISWAYERYGTDPAVLDLRYGIIPVVVAIVAHAVVVLSRSALFAPTVGEIGRVAPVLIAVGGLLAFRGGLHELLVLGAAGALGALVGWVRTAGARQQRLSVIVGPLLAVASTQPPLWRLGLVFLEIGSILYGSGYVLLAFLESRLVDDLGWLTTDQLLDAITIGQVTPGPVFTTATFVGWQIDGPAGAAVATVGIFLPAFVFVALLGRIVPWMRRHAIARAVLAGIVAVSLGLMAGVLVDLADVALVDPLTVAVALVALALLVRTTVSSAWLVLGGAVIGVLHAVA